MKSILLAGGAVIALCACAAVGQPTAWGKAGVSKLEYGTDLGICTGLAAQHGSDAGANTAGGVSGQNNVPHQEQPGRQVQQNQNGAPPSQNQAATSYSLPASGTYSGMASSDYAQRAATQQQMREMLTKRAQAAALSSCLTDRGYREFELTAEQRSELGKLRPGSNEYHEYLYKISSDPALAAAPAK